MTTSGVTVFTVGRSACTLDEFAAFGGRSRC